MKYFILLVVIFISAAANARTGAAQTRERRVAAPPSSAASSSTAPPSYSAPVVVVNSALPVDGKNSPSAPIKKTGAVLIAGKKKPDFGNQPEPVKKPSTAKPPSAPLIGAGLETMRPQNSKIEKMSDETLGGRMTVDVSENGNTLIKVGLAERAVAVIDFPVDDPVYKIHPGNENFVTVGCFGREPNGKCLNSPTDAIVLRPGKDFHALGSEESAATLITIQRVSGIVVTFLVTPVKTIAENTNYVAVHYDLADVLRNRRERGLAVNLLPLGATSSAADSLAANSNIAEGEQAQFAAASLTDNGGEVVPGDNPPVLQQTLVDEIQKAAANYTALKFSKPFFGISLARASVYASRVKDITIEVIAVRNTLPNAVRLVPDQPTLSVENKDSKDTSINVEPVNLLFTAATIEESEILVSGRIYYFAFAYRTPILGVRQLLRVNFAHREAADAPASIELSAARRKQ